MRKLLISLVASLTLRWSGDALVSAFTLATAGRQRLSHGFLLHARRRKASDDGAADAGKGPKGEDFDFEDDDEDEALGEARLPMVGDFGGFEEGVSAAGEEGVADPGEEHTDEEDDLPDDWTYDEPTYSFEYNKQYGTVDNSQAFQTSHNGTVKTAFVSNLKAEDQWEEDEEMAYFYTSVDDFPYPMEQPEHRGFLVIVTSDAAEDVRVAGDVIDRMSQRFGARLLITHHRFDKLPVDTYREFPETIRGSGNLFEIWFEGWEGKLLFSRNAQKGDKRPPSEEEIKAMIEDVDRMTCDEAYKHIDANRVEGI
uniref:Thioredoxin domain-containing protein n=1 Tax=Pinguiococcus pyrenoidosus TaxID=172671 RepID=A0A7R9YDW0_9STRA|mmetsp:Transcript_3330/g.13318  ORF Transcript_3330/g.13318 Transcript_3330/m.13318 type:complete len:311 (+) Transcript_3330:154-1086(+)